MPQTTPNPQQNLTADELQAASVAATTATTGNIENITIIDQAIQGCLGTIEQEREQEILTRRFGLNGKKETLEQIGGLLSITRERVRQLEKVILVRLRISSDENLIPNLSQAEKLMIRNLVELGRVAPTTMLAERIFGRPADQASVAKLNFIADISSLLTLVRSNDSYHEAIGIAEYGTELDIRAKVDEVVAAVRAHKKPILLEDLFEQLNGYEHPSFVAAVASVSKKLAHRGNLWGLSTWPEVNPRNIRDKIFILRKLHRLIAGNPKLLLAPALHLIAACDPFKSKDHQIFKKTDLANGQLFPFISPAQIQEHHFQLQKPAGIVRRRKYLDFPMDAVGGCDHAYSQIIFHSFSIQKGTIIGCYSDHSPEFATESQQLLSFPSWKTLP